VEAALARKRREVPACHRGSIDPSPRLSAGAAAEHTQINRQTTCNLQLRVSNYSIKDATFRPLIRLIDDLAGIPLSQCRPFTQKLKYLFSTGDHVTRASRSDSSVAIAEELWSRSYHDPSSPPVYYLIPLCIDGRIRMVTSDYLN